MQSEKFNIKICRLLDNCMKIVESAYVEPNSKYSNCYLKGSSNLTEVACD